MFSKFCPVLAVAIFCSSLAWQPASAVMITIDNFITEQNAAVDAAAPPTQFAGNSLNTVSAIGVERDLYVEKTAGGDSERVRARINPNGLDLLRQTIDDASGRVVLTWDGADGLFAPNQVAFAGLGGVDFTQALQLDLLVTFSDVGGPVHLTFWDAADLTGNTFATTTFNVPGAIPSGSMLLLSKTFLNPADFIATGGTLTSIFGNVGAIQMEIDARAVAQQGWDARFDSVRATGTPPSPIPEPSTLVLLGLGLAGIAGHTYRRHKHQTTHVTR